MAPESPQAWPGAAQLDGSKCPRREGVAANPVDDARAGVPLYWQGVASVYIHFEVCVCVYQYTYVHYNIH